MKREKCLFVLEAVTYTTKRRQRKDDYQPFTTDVSFISFYNKKEEAEVGIRKLLNEYDRWNFYCFYIYQVPFGFLSHLYCLDSYAVWLYDQTGNKIDERPYPSYQFGDYFNGRPKEKLRFHIGDVVEYRGELCIVISVPEEHYDRMLDDSDDSYCVLFLDQDFDSCEFYHSHPGCIEVMPPRFPISQKVQDQINRVKEWYAKCQREFEKEQDSRSGY